MISSLRLTLLHMAGTRIGDEERRLMHLVPAPAVRLMKRRVLSRPGLKSLMLAWAYGPPLTRRKTSGERPEDDPKKSCPEPFAGDSILVLGIAGRSDQP